jgi:nicotinate-nucleotide pyrophosphorylase
MTLISREHIRIAGGIKLAEMVVENLREEANNLVDVWVELEGSVDNVLVRSEAERDAALLNTMADRLEGKINDQLKAIH